MTGEPRVERRTGWLGALRRHPVLSTGALLLLILSGAVVLRRGPSSLSVEVGAPTRREVFRSYVNASGEIVATRYADIGSSVMGRLVELAVEEGDGVESGQVLARIDAVQARSDLAAAEALVATLESEARAAAEQESSSRSSARLAKVRAEEARRNLERSQSLFDEGLVPRSELDAAQASSDAAEAQAAAAAAQLDSAVETLAAAKERVGQARAQAARARDVVAKTEITAPMDGVVTRLQVRQGEMVVVGVQNQPGTILMTVSDLSSINAEVKVAEADVLRLEVGQPATVVLDALPDRKFSGKVVTVGASALPVTGPSAAREFRVVIRLDAPDDGLRPGLTCDAEVLTNEKRGVLTVPLQAVVVRSDPESNGERTGVFAVDGDVVHFVPVRAGIIGGLDIEVEGLEEGTSVVTGPFQALRELREGSRIERR